MMMKRLLVLMIISVFALQMEAQRGERDQRVEQMKIAFLTEKLDLSVEEGQRFWPVYNEYNGQKQQLEKRKREVNRAIRDAGDNITEDALTEGLNALSEVRNTQSNLDHQFLMDTMNTLGAPKARRLMLAMDEFRKELMKRLQQEKGRNGRNGGPRSNN